MPSVRRKPGRASRPATPETTPDAAAPAEGSAPEDAPTPAAAVTPEPPTPAAPQPAASSAGPAAPVQAPVVPRPAPAVPPPAPAAPVTNELLDEREPMLEPATEYELAPQLLLEPDAGGDATFTGNLDQSVLEFGASRQPARACEWCNTPLEDATAATCPTCGAPLQPVQPDLEIPGLTTMSLEAALARQRAEARRQGEGRTTLAGLRPGAAAPASSAQSQAVPLDEETVQEAVKPPDEEVRRLMLEMELRELRDTLEEEARARSVDDALEAASPADETTPPGGPDEPSA
ncbi:MAG: hypothetical protein ACXWPO_09130 [Candidatus Limnocylindrales bacterium]